jgi:hypothetical protein
MKTQIAYVKFVDENNREVQMSAKEKDKWKKWAAGLATFGMLVVGVIIGISGGSGGFRIRSVSIENLVPQNRMS